MDKQFASWILGLSLLLCACSEKNKSITVKDMNTNTEETSLDSIVVGGGCFWCVEAILQQIRGVVKVESGYSGGNTQNPTYKEVCTGKTGHAEVVKIHFDPKIIDLHTLLSVFMTTHDPTTLNRQGEDIGTQYRSVIFYASAMQKQTAEEIIKELSNQGIFDNPVVTEISPLINYYPAETYHQDYYSNNSQQPYCQAVISPKVAKFRKAYEAFIDRG